MEVAQDAAAEVATEVVDSQPGGQLDIKRLNLTDLALAQFGDWQSAVSSAKTSLAATVMDLSNASRIDEAKSLRWRLVGQPRADVRRISKDLKSKLAATSKSIGQAEEQIVAAYDEAEQLITPRIEAAEAEIERVRREKEEAERARVAAIREKINTIFAQPAACVGLPSGEIELSIVRCTSAASGQMSLR